jgi:ABC-type multidrug transport system fused ATPase/permease subunit
LDPEKTLWIIGSLFVISFAYYLPVTKGTSRLGKSQQFHQGEMIKWVNHGIYAFKEIRVGRKQDFFVEGFRESGEQFAQAKRFHRTVKAIPIRLIELIGVGAILLVVAATILRGGDPAAILPAMGVLAAAAVRLMPSVNRILSSITAIRHFYPALEVVADEFRAIQEPPRLSTSETLQSAPWDALRFDDVSYRYPGATKDAVSNVTFEIRSGESVALVGRSGSGKTTIADLLLGLLTPTAGRIALDESSSGGTYADRLVMGYVPQPSYLLDESVRHNVAFGVEDAEIDDQRVSDSLASVQMKEVVQAMDGQLDSRMGRDGVRMSGGQGQRLGIARALYDDPEILILDEATSALDNETERDVSEAIMALAGERTLLIVAHRLNTVKRCDKVLFFESGQLVADGDYDTLSVQCGPFRRLIEAGEI